MIEVNYRNINAGYLVEFSKFKSWLWSQAQKALKQDEPKYVHKFNEGLLQGLDVDEAYRQARPLLVTKSRKWNSLFTATLDYEYTLDNTRRALALLGMPCPPLGNNWNEGAWTSYHYDHFLFQFHAWHERLDKLTKKVCRSLSKTDYAEWQKLEKKLSIVVKNMKNEVAKIRDPLAHGGGGGVTGPEEQGVWEKFLPLTKTMDIVLLDVYKPMGQSRMKWHNKLFAITALAVARSEAIFKELNRHLANAENDVTPLGGKM